MKLEGRTALITGGAQGIGKAIAERFMKEGARVIVFDIQKAGYGADFFQVDISDEEQIAKAFENIKSLDILVNNAGITVYEPVEKMAGKTLDRVFDVNFKGTFLMSKHALPLIKKSKGSIINISSAMGIAPDPGAAAYCSSKAAIIMLTKCMAQGYGPLGVRVNAIAPGPIDTPRLRKAVRNIDAIRGPALRRVGRPEEVAAMALFLASDEASYVTGGIYSVDGGEACGSIYCKKRPFFEIKLFP